MDTITNLIEYRNNWENIISDLRHPEAIDLKNYMDMIYKALRGMRPGEKLDILKDVAPQNIEKFIKICCLFISDGNSDYIFSDNHIIKRLSEKQEKSMAEFLEKIALKKNKKNNELDKAEGTNNITA